MPSVTVAICTWNRARMLDRVLTHFRTVRIPANVTWELLVVDNNSSDTTNAVARSHADYLPMRVVLEATPGISHARNRAVAEATGEYIFWIDDDAFAQPDWIEQGIAALEEFQADIVFGTIKPQWEAGGPPSWYDPKFDPLFALLDTGGTARRMLDPRTMGFNVNMAVRTHTMRTLGGYRTAIGSGRMAGGEDTDLFQRTFAANGIVVYQPTMIVEHFIPRSRCTKSFYRRYMWVGSVNHLLLLRDEAKQVPTLLGIPRYFVRYQFGHLKQYLGGLVRRRPSEMFYHELKLIRFVGLYWALWSRVDPRTIGQRVGD